MKKLLAILLALAMLLSMAACGGEEDPNAGKYLGTTAEALGMTMDMAELYPGETWVELKSGGKGTMMLDGESVPMKWTLEGNAITITIDGVASNGTLANGILKVDLMNMGVEMTFEKEGGAIADNAEFGSIADQLETLATEPAVQIPGEAGIYEGITYEYQDLSFAMSEIYSEQCTLELHSDGKAMLTLDEEKMDCTWTLDGETFVLSYYTVASPGTMKDGIISIDYMGMGMIMTFEKTGAPSVGMEGTGETFPESFAADHAGDWHGMAIVYDGTGAFADEVDMEMEIIARLAFRDDGTCEPYLACAFGGKDNNFKNLSAAYSVDGDVMLLRGEFVNQAITGSSNLFAQDGALYVDVFVDDQEGNAMNLYACLRRLDAAWDYDNDWLCLPEDAVNFYKGKDFMEIAELFQVDLKQIPELNTAGAVPAETQAPAEATPTASASGFGGANSYQIKEYSTKIVTTVNFTLPETMWVADAPSDTLYIYNVESLDKAYSNSPRIQFGTLESLEKINLHADSFENLVELDSRVISGIEMQGRSYKFVGMQWIEYYGELPNGVWMSVQVSKTSVEPGTEGSAILDSVTFE